MRRLLSHPAAPSLVVFAGIVVAGFAAMILGWRVTARTLNVAAQLPAVISGGLGGLVLVVVGTALLVAQAGRVSAARDRAGADDLLDRAAEVVEQVRGKR